MQVSVKATGKLERSMRVEVPEERISTEVENRLLHLSRTTKLQGFRPGKAPMKLIKQRFGQQVRREVVGEVVQSTFFEAISREKLRPAGSPRIDPLEAEQGAGVKYTAQFEVMPEFELRAVEKLTIEKPSCTIGEEDIDRMVETLRKQRSRLEKSDRESRRGDVLDIDFRGSIGGEPFEGGEGKGLRVELGLGRLIPGFEEGLAGRKTGEEFRLELEFPADYHAEKLKGKKASFEVKVNQAWEPRLPELDEEFFRAFGVQEGGAAAFRKEVREHMEREATSVIRTRVRDSIMDALYKVHEIELPRTLVEQEQHRLRHQFEHNLKHYGIEAKAADDRLKDPKLFEEQARKRVALQLIVGEIVRRNELKPDPAKVRAVIERNAQSYEDPAAIVSWYYADRQRLADVENVVLEDAVIDWISGRARVTETGIPFDELVNNRQTAAK
ncbi:MAG TPA: trigger factor [Gammaproteobacteria bacterium]